MSLFDKFKNIFTEEVEEESIKKEVMQVEIPGSKEVEAKIESEDIEEKKEEKFVFPVYFDDKDFDDLEEKKEVKKEIYKPKEELYGVKPEVQDKKFAPSPVISPVYGVLDKNYIKDDVAVKSQTREYHRLEKNISIDDVRRKAYGSLEDELETSLFKDDDIYVERTPIEDFEPTSIIEDKIIEDYKPKYDDTSDNLMLDELNKLDDNIEDEKISESDLFNLIDSMYEKDEDNGNNE